MEKKTFQRFREVVYEKSGINLTEGKEALVTARVGKRMRALGIPTHEAYLEYVLNEDTGKEFIHLIDAISTNVTSFFRESNHFDFLAKTMANWIEKGQTRFRVWSAASSTGEEPYTIAITMLETAGNRNLDMKILATDISTRVLEQCVRGQYTREKVEPVEPRLRDRYFDKIVVDGVQHYVVKDFVKQMVRFRRLNLSTPPFPMRGPLDVIFCRNVMIYFDNRVRKGILDEATRLLKPGGYLMVGHAESLTGMLTRLKTVCPSTYVK